MGHLTSAPLQTYGFFANGNFHSSGNDVVINSVWDHSPIAIVEQASQDAVLTAVRDAVMAFLQTRKLSSFQRASTLRKIAARKEDFARTICREAGKPIRTARIEVDRSIYTFDVAAEEATRIYGEYIPLDTLESTAGRWGLMRRFPLGPVFAITPFNFPLNLVAHKIAPAIAAGCPIILKPAPQTPVTALMLAGVVHEAGWPEGALAVMPMSNETAGALVADDRIKLLTFTGSAAVGWQLKSKAGKKRVTLELGGNAGVIVSSSAEIETAVKRCLVGGFAYSGQICIHAQRIFVQRNVFEKFVTAFCEGAKKLKAGNPEDLLTEISVMIDDANAKRVETWVSEATAAGAKILCGGRREGAFYPPTVLTNTSILMKVNCEEVFGPVVCVEPYEHFSDAIRMINDTRFGLQAGVFTNDVREMDKAFNEISVGGVILNEVPTFRIDHMPYGGVKDSGLGREGVKYAMLDMLEARILVK